MANTSSQDEAEIRDFWQLESGLELMPNDDGELNEGLSDRASFPLATWSALEHCSLTEPLVKGRAPHLGAEVLGNGRYAYVYKQRRF